MTSMVSVDTWTRRVMFVGDSFVAGVGDPSALGWVGRIVAASFARGVGLTAYNLGVRLDTSEEVAARWRREVGPRLLDGTRPRLVLSFGANDTTDVDGRVRVAPARTATVLGRVLDDATALGLPILVIGPPLAGDDAQHERIRDLSPMLAAVCAARGVRFVEVARHQGAASCWVDQARHGDGSHPAGEGYAELAHHLVAAGVLDRLAS